jgi:hypothetical protein
MRAQIAVLIQNEMHKINGFKTVGKLNWIKISEDIADAFVQRWAK